MHLLDEPRIFYKREGLRGAAAWRVALLAERALHCQSPFFQQKHPSTFTCNVLNDPDYIAAH